MPNLLIVQAPVHSQPNVKQLEFLFLFRPLNEQKCDFLPLCTAKKKWRVAINYGDCSFEFASPHEERIMEKEYVCLRAMLFFSAGDSFGISVSLSIGVSLSLFLSLFSFLFLHKCRLCLGLQKYDVTHKKPVHET